MDVERTIEFILEREARVAVQLEEHSADIKEIREILKETNRKLNIVAGLVGFGIKQYTKIMANLQNVTASQAGFAGALQQLTESQQRTERKIDRLIDGLLRQGPNGRRR